MKATKRKKPKTQSSAATLTKINREARRGESNLSVGKRDERQEEGGRRSDRSGAKNE
jgi:hypothetical protein